MKMAVQRFDVFDVLQCRFQCISRRDGSPAGQAGLRRDWLGRRTDNVVSQLEGIYVTLEGDRDRRNSIDLRFAGRIRRSPLLKVFGGLKERAPAFDNRGIASSQMFLRAIDDRALTFLDRYILQLRARNPGK